MQPSRSSITPEQRQKLANLLKSRQLDSKVIGNAGVSEFDLGQLLPQMAAALQAGTGFRLERVVSALEVERIIVPMPVEKSGEAITQFPSVKTSLGQAVCIFSNAKTFASWRDTRAGEYRPVPMSAKKVALTAIAAGQVGFILDLGEQHSLLIPREVVEALAVASPWLAPWHDVELMEEMRRIAREQEAHTSGLVAVDLVCGTKPEKLAEAEQLSAVIPFDLYTVVVQLLVAEGSYLALNPRELAKIMAKLSTSARLKATCWLVEFQPKLVAPA